MKQLLETVDSVLWTGPKRLARVPVGFGRKSLDALPDERPVNVSGLHRFQRRPPRGVKLAREEEG
jgi:hypothetical protein